MQSQIAHTVERKAFEVAIDRIVKSENSAKREKELNKFVHMASALLKHTSPGTSAGMKRGLYPGSKWEIWLFDIVDETDPHVLRTVMITGGYEAAFRGLRTTTQNAAKHQCNVPWIFLFDPTSACNKQCVGCWAADYDKNLNLSYEDMHKLVSEGEALGCHFYMLTGGEPLVRKRDILRLANEHQDSLFNVFTNGSLIDEAFCADVAAAGNIVFSVSLESYEPAINDGRRGKGSFWEVMRAFDLMHDFGLLYGTSTCYTRSNVELVSSDVFLDLVISRGCRWAWYFHYMPVGEGANVDLMPTVEQRVYMMNRIRKMRAPEGGKPIFAMDFQNDGEFVGGCIAGGRAYCHINVRGDVEPCVFVHYSNANIKEKSLLECLQQSIFQSYRRHFPWNENHLRPCPMLENPEVLPRIVHESEARSTEYVSPEDVDNLALRVKHYAHAWEKRAEILWLEQHPTGKKEYDNDITLLTPDEKAVLIALDDENADGST